MTARVHRLHPEREDGAREMPERFSEAELRQLLEWAAARGYTEHHVFYAIESVRCWADRRPQPPRYRSWVRAIQGFMREGWVLRGFDRAMVRQGYRSRPLTPERIDTLVRFHREREVTP